VLALVVSRACHSGILRAEMPEDSDFLCGGWIWDPVLRELRYHARTRKGWKDEPVQVERLPAVRSVTWHRWSQPPMQTATGQTMPSGQSRLVIAYEGGGDLTLNENDRECAGNVARAIAEAYGLEVVEDGAPGGRRRGTLPSRDKMGRLVNRSGRVEVTLDGATGEIVESRRRFPFGTSRRTASFAEVRRLELTYEVTGPLETFTLWALVGPEEEPGTGPLAGPRRAPVRGQASGRLAVASYQGYEGWADPEEWREFAQELGRQLGIAVSGG